MNKPMAAQTINSPRAISKYDMATIIAGIPIKINNKNPNPHSQSVNLSHRLAE